ncbi:MAG: hypothetical protein WC775_02825 [Patescibacteria group bacterium]|jgi:hypothetical protein
MTKKRKIQIAVVGSMFDLPQNRSTIALARDIGRELATNKAVLLYSFEGDSQSLSYIAAREAEKCGGEIIAFLWGNTKVTGSVVGKAVRTGQLRGGGREFPLILSANAVISIGGGSGTLMEIAMSYQAGIPVIALENTGGWSERLMNTFMDERKRNKVLSAKDARSAVLLAIKESI